MKKKIENKHVMIIFVIIIFILLIVGVITLFYINNKSCICDDEFRTYYLDVIKVANPKANLVFIDDLPASNQIELNVKEGDSIMINEFGGAFSYYEEPIEIIDIGEDYIEISTKGLAPTQLSGGFSLMDEYNTIKIYEYTGRSLNVQATDLYDGGFYVFYIDRNYNY